MNSDDPPNATAENDASLVTTDQPNDDDRLLLHQWLDGDDDKFRDETEQQALAARDRRARRKRQRTTTSSSTEEETTAATTRDPTDTAAPSSFLRDSPQHNHLQQQQQQQQLRQSSETTTKGDDDNIQPIVAEQPHNSNNSNTLSNSTNGNINLLQQQTNASSSVPDLKETNKPNHDDDNRDDDSDEFDMFSSSVSPLDQQRGGATKPASNNNLYESSNRPRVRGNHEQQDWDDAEGYYKAVIGETIHLNPMQQQHQHSTSPGTNGAAKEGPASASSAEGEDPSMIRLRVAGVMGKGVFSTVLKCTVISNSTSIAIPPVTALKCIRHNETMAKAATTTELALLLRLQGCPGIVPLFLPLSTTSPLEHRGHVVLVFAFMEYNLRDVLLKFGKGVGLSLQAVRSYFGQLLSAATHLQKHGIVHADLKPDNILVSADFAVVQMADFGSAMDVSPTTTTTTSSDILTPTPYLVSRFYRAPEIILGLPPTYAIDLWSLAVTVAELYLGDVLFRGTSNNDMLFVMQQHMGAVSNRVIRQHFVAQKRFAVPAHFQMDVAGGKNAFLFTQQTTDSVTGAPVHKVRSLVATSVDASQKNVVKFPLGTPLPQRLKQAKSAKDARKMVQQFIDLLSQCLALDPTRRIVLKEALRHEFFQTTTKAPPASATAGSIP